MQSVIAAEKGTDNVMAIHLLVVYLIPRQNYYKIFGKANN